MKYRIVTGDTPIDLEKDVRSYLDDGWELQGGVSVYHYASGVLKFAQAIKQPTNPEKP